jgi:hypothetical protein
MFDKDLILGFQLILQTHNKVVCFFKFVLQEISFISGFLYKIVLLNQLMVIRFFLLFKYDYLLLKLCYLLFKAILIDCNWHFSFCFNTSELLYLLYKFFSLSCQYTDVVLSFNQFCFKELSLFINCLMSCFQFFEPILKGFFLLLFNNILFLYFGELLCQLANKYCFFFTLLR